MNMIKGWWMVFNQNQKAYVIRRDGRSYYTVTARDADQYRTRTEAEQHCLDEAEKPIIALVM